MTIIKCAREEKNEFKRILWNFDSIYRHISRTRLSFNDVIRIMAVSRADSATVGNSFKPYQAYLALNQYPLTRNVYILLNDPKSGLPSGLTSFLTDFRGQRIILKSGLVPATAAVRIVDVKEE